MRKFLIGVLALLLMPFAAFLPKPKRRRRGKKVIDRKLSKIDPVDIRGLPIWAPTGLGKSRVIKKLMK